MKGYLFDTSIVLLAITEPEKLSKRCSLALEQGDGFLSVISYWEVMVKSMKGRLQVGEPKQWWRETVESLDLPVLTLRPDHITAIGELPLLHADPFDRALIGQAIAEKLTFVTTDVMIARYTSERFETLS